MAKLKIALAQMDTKLGDIESNLQKHLELIEAAREKNAGLITFPELSLTGYYLQDLTPSVARIPDGDDPCFDRLLDASQGIDILVGFVEEDRRHRFYNSSAYLSLGEVLHIHRKVYLPTYGLFDEGRFFAWGDQVRAFDTPHGRVGILICEDFWHASPPYLLWLDGAEVMLLVSASPGRGLHQEPKLESANWVEQINKAYASLFTTFIVHTNRTGYEDGLHFWGGSTVVDPDGNLITHGPYQEESLIISELDLGQLRRTRSRLPLLRDERTALMIRELRRILMDQS
jgi:NAD+ synthase (glutamine-hydrolysing)